MKDGKHVACGYVNAKNSFGAMAGASPWLMIVETKTAIIETEQNQGKFGPLWNKYCSASQDAVQSRRAAPDAFRGIKWDSALPSAQKLQETVLKNCAAIVEQKNFTDKKLVATCTSIRMTWNCFLSAVMYRPFSG